MSADTIAAIATALGEGGIGIVRLSGPEAIEIASTLSHTRPRLTHAPTHTVHHAWIRSSSGHLLDEGLVTIMRAPRSYTGEDIVEFGLHGGPIQVRRVLKAALQAGARLAERGEFTKRAFLNGRLDLSQAEAVADVIAARTGKGADVALNRLAGHLARRTSDVESRLVDFLARLETNLDFNEDVEAVDRQQIGDVIAKCESELLELRRRAPWGRRVEQGATVVLVGKPNVGKSTLFNALLEDERALVSDVPGTTRDYLEAWIDLEGMPVRLVDTAGMREASDEIEREGVKRASRLEELADLRLVIVDASNEIEEEDSDVLRQTEGRPRIVVRNKCDLLGAEVSAMLEEFTPSRGGSSVEVSATTGAGIAALRASVATTLEESVGGQPADAVIPNARHEEAIARACTSLSLAKSSWSAGESEELIAADVRNAVAALGEVTGRTVGEDVLDRIFSSFCIGK